MTSLVTGQSDQYSSSERLAARARLVSQYTITDHPWARWVAGHLALEPGDRILDIGCGPAWFWEHAGDTVPSGLDLTLTDLSPGMVDEAMERCEMLAFRALTGLTADAASLPFKDGTFDGAIAMHMLYHVADPGQAVAEMYRILKPGGFLAVTTNGIDNMRPLHELTTAFGGTPYDPAAAVFGFAEAQRLLTARFGAVTCLVHPAHMEITSPEDVFLALTSYPPGDQAAPDQLADFRSAIDAAFEKSGGVLTVPKQTGLFVATKEL